MGVCVFAANSGVESDGEDGNEIGWDSGGRLRIDGLTCDEA